MIGEAWWVTLLVALIAATPPTLAVWVALKRLDRVYTVVNSTHDRMVQALADATEEITTLREQLCVQAKQAKP